MKKLSGVEVLVVDDESGIREILRDVLELQGAAVHDADSGRSAYAYLSRVKIDVLLSDVKMPDGSGIELLKKMRLCQVRWPLTFLYSGGTSLNREQAKELGAIDLLEKPIRDDDLVAAIVKAMGEAAAVRNLFGA